MDDISANRKINRRDFLRWMGLVIGGITIGSIISHENQDPIQVAFNGKLYRGTFDGKILESVPNVLVWSEKSNFGKDCSVKRMAVVENHLHAQLDFHGLPIDLHSADGQTWYTAGYQAPT